MRGLICVILSILAPAAAFGQAAAMLLSVQGSGGSSSSTLNTDLIAYWKLDEASGNRSDEVGSNTLVDNGTVGSTSGLINNASTHLQPAVEYFTVADNPDLSFADEDFSLSIWVYMISTNNNRYIINKGAGQTAADQAYGLYYAIGGARFVWVVSDGTTRTTVSANNFGQVPLNTWLHIAVWHDHGTDIGIAVNDGTPNTSSHTAGVQDEANTFYMGVLNSGSFFPWDGRFDEAGLWGKVLSPSEITALYNAGSGVTCCPF